VAPDELERAAAAAAAGVRDLSPTESARLRDAVSDDPDGRVRAAALGAVVRRGDPTDAATAWKVAVRDRDADVRRRAAETAPALSVAPFDELLALVADEVVWVAEAAAFALGETVAAPARVVSALASTAVEHEDALVRESAVAALGAIGDPSGLGAVLHGCTDKPAIRRRAVLALASFEGDDVEAALRRALDDADWQTRQNAEDVLNA
jgi:HEAT repeat protein